MAEFLDTAQWSGRSDQEECLGVYIISMVAGIRKSV